MLRSKQNIKKIVQCALKSEFGFAPALSEISLYRSLPDGTHALFVVNNKKYRFDSYVITAGGLESVWVGSGTIRRGWTS